MKRRILLSCIALCGVVMSMMAQRSYNFNAVALNVDGLPEKVSGISINASGPLSEGTKTLSSLIAQKDWGFVGLSEDFDFHTELMSSISDLYNSGTHRGKITGTSNNTDGLGLLCAKWYSFSNESWTQWNKSDGSISDLIAGKLTDSDYDNGADELIKKGYRYYKITIASGFDIDVYVLHMDAASRQDDIDARESQLKQLASAVKTNMGNNKRPVIILGDTNCRYTRDELKTAFIDVLNADSRFTIKDAWVELMWGGVYPTYGSDAMMTHTYGAQRGEIVDKVFYINTTESNLTLKANNYLHDTSITASDHYPVVVNFTLTDENGTPASFEMETPDETVETWTDESPTSPTKTLSGTYYLRNVHSGLFLKGGMNWGAHIGEGVDGMPITMSKVSGNTYKLSSTITVVGDNLYTDNGNAYAGNWAIQEIKSTSNKGNSMTKYILKGTSGDANGKYIASSGNGYYAEAVAYNKTDTKQHWTLYTESQMKAAIKSEAEATLKGATYNVSGLITLPVCCHESDSRQTAWTGKDAVSVGGRGVENNAAAVWEVFRDGVSHEFDFNQTVSGLPNGTYTVKVQAFFRDGDANTSSTKVEPVLYAGNKSKTIHSILDGALPSKPSWEWGHNGSAGWIPNDMWQANQWFKAGHYVVTLENVTVTNGTLKIGIKNTSTATSMAWCCFDNFQLYYHGTAQGDLRTSALYKSIKAAADEAIAAVESVNSAEATAAFDISAVAYRYNNNLVSADGAWEFAAIDNAVKTAVAAQTAKESNMSLLINNNSFEKGTTEGWSVLNANDTGAKSNTNETYTTTGIDGNYLFNTWSAAGDECGILHQEITGLRNGYYRLNALVTAWNNRTVYLVGNKQYVGLTTLTDDGKEFKDLALDFLVEDGKANIGAVGDYAGGFNYKKGTFFKADNFRLTYMGSIGEGRVKIALADAKAKADKLHEGAKNQFYNAVGQYENATVKGDGKTEEAAIYNALKAAIATQPRTETDMTWLITNPGFETGDWTGWTTVYGWDSRVAHATSDVAPNNGEGQYIMNTWNDFVDALNSGVNAPVHQTLSGLPNGRYRLTANVTSDGGQQVTAYATVNGNNNYAAASPENNATFMASTVEFDVTGNADVTIGAVGLREGAFNLDGGCWYKADNFRLTYLGHEGKLYEGTGVTADDWYTSLDVTRTMKKDKWNTFVVPFDMDIPEGWEVKELTSSTMIGDAISLVFGDASTIEAGVAYMVCVESDVSELSTVMNVQVSTELTNPSTNDIEFVGVYEAGKIPAGAFFISNNVFYQAADDTNTIKAFRAYLMPKGQAAKARSLSYRFDDEEGTTSIEEATEEVTVVGIYTPGGMRIDDLQEGVNILQMSNGTTVKVIIK